jgi:hypothetical protein
MAATRMTSTLPTPPKRDRLSDSSDLGSSLTPRGPDAAKYRARSAPAIPGLRAGLFNPEDLMETFTELVLLVALFAAVGACGVERRRNQAR